MAFKRDLAKQYFGTDDPAELEKLFPTWDAFKKAGLDVQQKSGGKVFMMSSLGMVLQIMKGQSTTPFFVNGNKLNLETSMQPILEQLIDFKKNKVTDILDSDSPEEGASYATNEHIFYPCANWSLVYSIRSNDRNGQGRWGFMLPPGGPFPWGGTVMAVPKKAVHKDTATTYIRYFFGSEQGAIHQRDFMGNFSPFKPLYQNPDFYSAEDEYFRGQNVQQVISQHVLPNIKGVRPPSRYDQDVNDEFNLAIKSINAGSNVTAVALIAGIKDDLINKNPEITQ
jgi:multiple sugar transport system substrate-binding protein